MPCVDKVYTDQNTIAARFQTIAGESSHAADCREFGPPRGFAGLRYSSAWLVVGAILALANSVLALDLRQARVSAEQGLSGPEQKAVAMLVEETFARTGLVWPGREKAAARGRFNRADTPVIIVRRAKGSGPTEGFHLVSS